MDFIKRITGKRGNRMEYRHVFCVNCIHWEELAESVIKETDLPDICGECYPYDFEDSRGNDLRTKYIERSDL